ncbi:hypothetical protein VPNG_05788 [Cytospora leucostoma]|uniref:Uncharacterized protein n=1 Tax=Cytospora leucostoma TaxID=1230097 RepID=A0A423X0H9_9PEZI|nr:hypothetical protein VPNG_05788 [Cytospora leucostoma]
MPGQSWATVGVAVISALVYLATRFYASRKELRNLQRENLPMPDFDPVFGHLRVLKEASSSLPPDTIMHNVMWKLAQQNFPGGIFYLHLWPFSRTLLVVADAYTASQVEDLGLGKGDNIVKPIETITGGPSLLTMEGAEWKHWRRLFSIGFSAGYLIGLAPAIADEVAVFRDLLIKKCRNAPDGRSEVFPMEEMTVRMTFDVIGRVVLDTHFQYQLHENSLASALRSSVEWTSWRGQLNPVTRYLSIRSIVHWLNSRTMDRYIGHEIDKRFAERIEGIRAAKLSGSEDPNKQSKSIVSLLIDDVVRESGNGDIERAKQTVKKAMSSQLRVFLFAGHDTSSAALTYCYYLLSTHPTALDLLLTEHNTIFGDHPGDALVQIHSDPHKLNQLPYTTALLKETLRLFPPAGSMRLGRPGTFLFDETGRRFPTENCSVWTLSLAIHHDARYWVEPEKFLPERWLVGPDDPLYPGRTKGAWRPFEHGPRNCIGQSLALLELKIVLVLTAREINVIPAYEEWDAFHSKRGSCRKDQAVKTVNGIRAYQAEKGAAHPADGFPVRVKLRPQCGGDHRY